MIAVITSVAFAVLASPRDAVAQSPPQDHEVNLSPAAWPERDINKFAVLDGQFGGQNALATSNRGVVSGTTSSSAIRAGLTALEQGGSAADAALTTALTQVSLSQGAWVSYAGIFSMMYYDAQSGQVYCLNGCYNTVLNEGSAATIPAEASGRTALVPGFMRGVEAAHERFGRLPFKSLFQPAIYFAENGYPLHDLHVSNMERRQAALSRLARTKELFINKETGEFFKTGDLYRQPALAATLRAVSEQGADYMYSGAWGQRLVAAIQEQGGHMTQEDLNRYQVRWTNPTRIQHAGHDIFAPGLPAQGGVHLAESLHLYQESDLASRGYYQESPESFFWLSQINNAMIVSFLPRDTQRLIFGKEMTYQYRRSRAYAKEIWPKLREGAFPLLQKPNTQPNHSDAVVTIDQWGNMAAVVHTSNTDAWGTTGIFVDGVSIPDSAAKQQVLINETVPGDRLPDPTEPLIVMKDGQPVAAISSIGAGLHAKTMTSLINLLEYDRDIKSSIDAPSMHLPEFGDNGMATQRVFAGDFSEELINGVKELGLRIIVQASGIKSREGRGYVVGASIDPSTGKRAAVATDVLNATAMGQD